MAERSLVRYDFSVTVQEFTASGLPVPKAPGPNNITIITEPEQMGPALVEWGEYIKHTSCPECEMCLTNFLYVLETRHFIKLTNIPAFLELTSLHLRLNQ